MEGSGEKEVEGGVGREGGGGGEGGLVSSVAVPFPFRFSPLVMPCRAICSYLAVLGFVAMIFENNSER